MNGITAIMSSYERPGNMQRQYNCLQAQSVPPKDILMFHNQGSKGIADLPVKTIRANHNFLYYGRFAMALLAKTEFVCVFDDDTIPGESWFANCLETMRDHEGLLGTVGVTIYRSGDTFKWKKTGWCKPNQNVVEVDFVGHCWFFKREWLWALWRESIPCWSNGEDIFFSSMVQKYLGLNTYVPPHPVDHKEYWGSIDGELGGDPVASYKRNPNHYDQRIQCIRTAIENGWNLLNVEAAS